MDLKVRIHKNKSEMTQRVHLKAMHSKWELDKNT